MKIFDTCICIAILIFLMCPGQCAASKQLKYQNCSSSNLCFSCRNQYFCEQCAPGVDCCPKYCKACINMTYCTTCQKGFELTNFYGHKDWCACSNNDSTIDPRRMRADSTKCKNGYYFHEVLEFCQKCLVPNCKLCLDSLHCSQCEFGFTLANGTCVTAEVKPTPPVADQKEQIQTISKQRQQSSSLIFVIMGTLIGLCVAYIVVKQFSQIKRTSIACGEWLRNKYNHNRKRVERQGLVIEPEVMNSAEIQIPSLNDEQKQYSILQEAKDDRSKMSRIINDRNDARGERKPVITQQRYKF